MFYGKVDPLFGERPEAVSSDLPPLLKIGIVLSRVSVSLLLPRGEGFQQQVTKDFRLVLRQRR
jgi:hypothetical protein